MKRKNFRVKAVWDAEAEVFYSESDVEGLHIESASLEEFEQILLDVGPDLIVDNHLRADDMQNRPVADLIPVILLKEPSLGNKAVGMA